MTSGLDWTGPVGDVWAAEWRRTDRSFADLSRQLDAAVLAGAPERAFRAFDIGCGAGGTSLALAAARPDATITGVDLSEGLIDVARERATGSPSAVPRRRPGPSHDEAAALSGTSGAWTPAFAGERSVRNAEFEVGDAIAAAGGLAPVDLIYSRHGVMFFDDPIAAFSAFHTAANPGASLVFSCFADWSDNAFAKAIADAIGTSPPAARTPGPFAFADPDYVAAILAAAGWRKARPTHVPFAYRAGESDDPVADALSFFQRIGPAAPILRAAPIAERETLLDRIAAVVADHRVGNAIDFPALAWIWSARA